MPLLVETGSGASNSDSLASVASFKAYSGDFGFDYSAYTDTQIEVALRTATRYLGQRYRTSWKGFRTTGTQALDWPRYSVFTDNSGWGLHGGYRSYQFLIPNNVVPTDVVHACCILAQKSITGTDLFADGTQKTSEKTVGPITVKYEQGSPQRKQFDSALLAVYLTSTTGICVPLVRG